MSSASKSPSPGSRADQFLELVGSHQYDMFWLQWIADFPHPQSYLEPPWACGGWGNASGYCNPELDRLLAEAATTVDEAEQLDLYGQAQRVLVGDDAHIFVQWRGAFALVAPRVDGLVVTPFDSLYGLMFPEQIRIVAD